MATTTTRRRPSTTERADDEEPAPAPAQEEVPEADEGEWDEASDLEAMEDDSYEEDEIARNAKQYPPRFLVAVDFDPNDHMIQLKGRDYLNVQSRLLWFIRDQRALIVSGLAKMPYVVRTELVELDRANNWAHFRTYVRDVLGNEATMYGSESAKDFADYAEKASTKSVGRALLALGYGTAFAPEMDEGDRVVDTPQATRSAQHQQRSAAPQPPQRPQQQRQVPAQATTAARAPLPPATGGTLTIPAFLNEIKTLGLSQEQAMRELGVRSFSNVNLTAGLERLRQYKAAGAIH